MTTRSNEQFREDLYHDWSADELRIMPAAMVARWVDSEVANRLRMDIYHQKKKQIEHMTVKSGTDAQMEKLRGTKGDYSMGAREFALGDDVAAMYFDFYSENFEGGPVVDNSQDGYTCPWCKLHYGMSLKEMPDHCLRCGSITPLGRLKRDGAFRR